MNEKEYQEFLKRLDKYTKQIQILYGTTIEELSRIYKKIKFDPDTPFSFSNYKKFTKEERDIFLLLYSSLYQSIKNSITLEWNYANVLTDSLINFKLGIHSDDTLFKKYYSRNNDALKAFFARNNKEGLSLSQIVWRNTIQFKQEVEMAFDIGFREGRSATAISKDIRGYLNDPDKLFRRVRDIHGNLHLSKNAKAYHPGQGIYRSSYKNSMRLTRTIVNTAHREATRERWQNLDFVVGYEIKRSNNPYSCPVCEALAGKYPKSFKFVGWHPQCRCYIVSIMATDDEFALILDKILHKESLERLHSKNEIISLPDNFKNWLDDNKNRLIQAKYKPYFIKDNFRIEKDKMVYLHG